MRPRRHSDVARATHLGPLDLPSNALGAHTPTLSRTPHTQPHMRDPHGIAAAPHPIIRPIDGWVPFVSGGVRNYPVGHTYKRERVKERGWMS